MPFYVDDADKPGTPVDVIELQGRDPVQVLTPYLLPGWTKRDTWSRREALMLLAGYDPDATQWTEDSDGFGQFSAGNVGYLDGMSESMIRHANVYWRHPRSDEALKHLWTLSDYAKGGALEERKAPNEWIAWADSKGFIPYWFPLAGQANPTTAEPGSGMESASPTAARKGRRRDAIAIVIDEVVAKLKSCDTRVTATSVMDALIVLARTDDRIDVATNNTGITWTQGNGKSKTLTQSMLDDRLRNAGHIQPKSERTPS